MPIHLATTITAEEIARRGYGYVLEPRETLWFRGDRVRLADGGVYVLIREHWAYAEIMRTEDPDDALRPELTGLGGCTQVWLRPETSADRLLGGSG